ncbi:MAG: NAD(P)-dependent oxidoreductase [Bacteroidota bacterium]
MHITFVGLGIMGSRMAANLLKQNITITVWNRTHTATLPLEKLGATVVSDVNLAVMDADLVFSMLSTPEAIDACFLGENGALSNMKANALWVDCTTVNPSFSRRCAAAAQARGLRFIDAPVAGSKPQAAAAQLAFFVGANAEEITPIRPYLEAMGAKIIPLRERGQGAAFKMLVNVMLAQSMLIFSESVLLGERLGLDKDFLLDVLPGLVVSAPFTKFKAAMIRSNDYEVQFPLEWMHKDLHLATLTAYEEGQPLYLANLTKEVFAAARKAGMGRLDFAAIHQYLEKERNA